MGKPCTAVDALLVELKRLQKDEDGNTVEEWAKLCNRSKHLMQPQIKQLVLEGRMVLGQRHVEHDWDGRARTYRVYRLAK